MHYKINININPEPSVTWLLGGIFYHEYLKQLHLVCEPASYVEIGVECGDTLAFAQCRAVAIDPKFQLQGNPTGSRVETHFFQLKSDEFFLRYNLKNFFPDGIDFAFLDGMHHFEFLLRDFMNTEKYSHKETIVALHDCYPVYAEAAHREPSSRIRWWAGDVWKILPILRAFRPELDVSTLDCPPTGLVIIRGLDANSKVLLDAYDEVVAKYLNITLENFGIEQFRKEFPTTDSRNVFQPDAMKSFLSR